MLAGVGFREKVLRLVLVAIVFLVVSKSIYAKTISFSEVVEQVVSGSYEVALIDLDYKISQSVAWEKAADFLPNLNARFSTEYVKSLRPDADDLFSISNMLMGNQTKYQSSVSLDFSYTLSDYGVRAHALNYAIFDRSQKEIEREKTVKDLSLNILELYKNILVKIEQKRMLSITLKLQKEILGMTKRLRKAKVISAVELTDAAIEMSTTIEQFDTVGYELDQYLQELTYFTKQTYNQRKDVFMGFEVGDDLAFNQQEPEDSYEYKIADFEVKKKEEEFRPLGASVLPKVDTYASYGSYGSDPKKLLKGIHNISKQNFVAGVDVTVPLFEWLKVPLKHQRIKKEIQRLKLERARLVDQLNKNNRSIMDNIELASKNVVLRKTVKGDVYQKANMKWKLGKSKLVYQTEQLRSKIEKINEDAVYKISKINKDYEVMRFMIINKG